MKITYLANTRMPSERAHSVQIVKMCNAFAEIGHEVILCASNRQTHITTSPEVYYGEKFNFKLRKTSVIDTTKYTKKIPKIFHSLSYLLQCISYVVNLGRLEDSDAFYGRDPAVLFLVGIRWGFSRLVYESHEARYNWFVRQLIKHKVKIVVISEGIQKLYLQKGVSEKQILIAHDGIDSSFFQPHISKKEARIRLNLPLDAKIAMYIGGFDIWKGVDTFFKASELTSDIKFVAIGGNEDEISKFSKLYPKVIFLGFQPYRELVYNQQAADVLVIPNTAKNKLSAEYTSPLKLFAHMTSKKVLVLSDIPSLRAVVPYKYAYYYSPDMPRALAKTVQEAVQNNTEVKKKVIQLYEIAKKFTWKERSTNISIFVLH